MYLNSRLNSAGLIDICSTSEGFDIFNSVVLINLHRLVPSTGLVKNSSRSDLLAKENIGTPHGISQVSFACDCDIDKVRLEKVPGDSFNYYETSDIKNLLDKVVKKNSLTTKNRI